MNFSTQKKKFSAHISNWYLWVIRLWSISWMQFHLNNQNRTFIFISNRILQTAEYERFWCFGHFDLLSKLLILFCQLHFHFNLSIFELKLQFSMVPFLNIIVHNVTIVECARKFVGIFFFCKLNLEIHAPD